MNTGVHGSFQIMFFSSYMSKNVIAGSYGKAIFSFYIPSNNVGGFPSLQNLSIIYCLWIMIVAGKVFDKIQHPFMIFIKPHQKMCINGTFVAFHSLRCIQLFATPWTVYQHNKGYLKLLSIFKNFKLFSSFIVI